jgi:hypothetical protein
MGVPKKKRLLPIASDQPPTGEIFCGRGPELLVKNAGKIPGSRNAAGTPVSEVSVCYRKYRSIAADGAKIPI